MRIRWYGKNSSYTKHKKDLSMLLTNSFQTISASKLDYRLDYLSLLSKHIYKPLKDKGKVKVP